MKSVSEINDREKSVMLARVCGWEPVMTSFGHPCWLYGANAFYNGSRYNGSAFEPLDLYDPANMELVWRVLNWASKQWDKGHCWGWEIDEVTDFELEPANQIRAWLDKILTLAIEAGMVTE